MAGAISQGGSTGMQAPRAPSTRGTFRLEGEFWTIAFGTEICRLRDSAGLRYLAVLLCRPGVNVLAADLVVLAGPSDCRPRARWDGSPRRTCTNTSLPIVLSLHFV